MADLCQVVVNSPGSAASTKNIINATRERLILVEWRNDIKLLFELGKFEEIRMCYTSRIYSRLGNKLRLKLLDCIRINKFAHKIFPLILA